MSVVTNGPDGNYKITKKKRMEMDYPLKTLAQLFQVLWVMTYKNHLKISSEKFTSRIHRALLKTVFVEGGTLEKSN